MPTFLMTLYLIFASTADDTIRTSLRKEIRLALRSHKALFYYGDLLLSVTSSIQTPPILSFKIALLTLLSLDQADRSLLPRRGPGEFQTSSLASSHRSMHPSYTAFSHR
jgi:hypothetical protein